MFHPCVTTLIGESNIDRPSNALSMTPNLHQRFGDFKLYFEPAAGTTNPHTYKIALIRPLSFRRERLLPVTRTLLLSPNHNIDPPDPGLLAIHRACVFILHLSGAGEYIDRILRDLEEVEIKEDGSTALGQLVGLRLDGWLNEIRVQ